MIVLISPISPEEALGILDCGVDIIDVKNVDEGSLGAQFPWRTREVVDLCGRRGICVSATLGDLPFKPGTASLAAYGVASLGVGYVKAGLHGMNTYEEAFEMMDAIRRSVRMVSETAAVVASGYADYRRFDGLNPLDLVQAAKDAVCDVVMVDTAIKDGKGLFDNLSMQELHAFVGAAKDAGLKVALAGSIGREDADCLFELDPHIIGVRGAVCAGVDRKTAISPTKTHEFVRFFHQTDATG